MEGTEGAEKPESSRPCCWKLAMCIRLSPFVPLVCTIMITVGLPFWVIYTRRALDASLLFSDTLLGEHTFAASQLSRSVSQVTGLGIIIVSVVVGLGLCLSLLRSYQETAGLPTTRCGPPKKASYQCYVTLISVITFSLWLMSMVVALLIAAQLCWLLLAFLFRSALQQGVQSSGTAVQPQAYYDATKAVLSGLYDDPRHVAAGSPLAPSVAVYLSAAKQTPVVACPLNCLNLGSFYAAFGASQPCTCTRSDTYPMLADTVTDIWQSLVHALAALALMGVAALWLIMNLSAQFAHAKRDLRDLKKRYAPEPATIGSGDTDAVYVSTNPTFSRSPEKPTAGISALQDTIRDADTSKSAGSAALHTLHESPPHATPPHGAPSRACGGGAAAAPVPRDDYLPLMHVLGQQTELERRRSDAASITAMMGMPTIINNPLASMHDAHQGPDSSPRVGGSPRLSGDGPRVADGPVMVTNPMFAAGTRVEGGHGASAAGGRGMGGSLGAAAAASPGLAGSHGSGAAASPRMGGDFMQPASDSPRTEGASSSSRMASGSWRAEGGSSGAGQAQAPLHNTTAQRYAAYRLRAAQASYAGKRSR